jgi:hypothetical protein
MSTKFGRKSKPIFKVVEWRKDGSLVEGDEPPLQLTHESTMGAKAVDTAKAINDEVAW